MSKITHQNIMDHINIQFLSSKSQAKVPMTILLVVTKTPSQVVQPLTKALPELIASLGSVTNCWGKQAYTIKIMDDLLFQNRFLLVQNPQESLKPASDYKLIRRFRLSRRCHSSCRDFRLATGTLRLADYLRRARSD